MKGAPAILQGLFLCKNGDPDSRGAFLIFRFEIVAFMKKYNLYL